MSLAVVGRSSPRFAGALAGLLCLSACGDANEPAWRGVAVEVDAAAAGAPLRPIWAFHGYDELNYTTTPEGRALLSDIVKAHSAPVRVRTHFLFNSGDGTPGLKWGSTNVYTEDAEGNPVYDWTLTDGILDTFAELGAIPFVELGFMPEALANRPKPYRPSDPLLLNGGCFSPPDDYAKWGALVKTWAEHVNGRYPDVSQRWLWELWNEPDSAYWHGSVDEFTKLYDYSEAALHEVLPQAQLGGPAVIAADGPFLKQFLQHCVSGTNAVTGGTGTRLDLVTFHAKGGVTVEGGDVLLDLGNQLRLHRAGFEAVASFPELKQKPIYITEADPDGCAACGADLVQGAAYRTSPAYGAYELAMMKRSLELASELEVDLAGVLAWAFTFPGTGYFSGNRVLASSGIHLPVLGAFELLGRLSGARLPLNSSGARSLDELLAEGVRTGRDVDGMAARDGATIRVLLWAYQDRLVATPAERVQVRLKLPRDFANTVRVAHLRVDETHGDAYSTWRALGSPANPSAEQRSTLEANMTPVALPEERLSVGADDRVRLDFELPTYGVSLLTVTPAD